MPSHVDTTCPSANFATIAIHGAHGPDPSTGAILTPIFQSTTFVQSAVGRDQGFNYSRAGNPTVAALETALGRIEDAPPAVCFATGMAATTALFTSLLQQGDRVVCSRVVYGGTVRLLRQILARFGVRADFVDTRDPRELERALETPAKIVLVESPANPTLDITDLAHAATAAHAAGAILAVDNTFLTPALQRPLELGADVALYSTTKYIEGHNSTVGGALVTKDEELRERFRFTLKAIGFGQSPFEAWLTLRGLKTLEMRMERHSRNALAVAEFLRDHPRVSRVAYPGLEDDPGFAVAQRQQTAGGGMVSFELEGGTEAGIRLMNSLRLCSLAENLGAVETLVTHPASMTHADIPSEERSELGITDGLVRLSVGLESVKDVRADLARALEVK